MPPCGIRPTRTIASRADDFAPSPPVRTQALSIHTLKSDEGLVPHRLGVRCDKVVVGVLQFGEDYSAQSEDGVVGGRNLYHTVCVAQLIQPFSV
jgi:hypothetical protein